MSNEELSGAVRILCQTACTGTVVVRRRRSPNSERQSSTFITTQNKEMNRKLRRHHIGFRPVHHCMGMLTTWPVFSRLASSAGLAAMNALNFTPYLRAMDVGVSPVTTVCAFALDAVVPPALSLESGEVAPWLVEDEPGRRLTAISVLPVAPGREGWGT